MAEETVAITRGLKDLRTASSISRERLQMFENPPAAEEPLKPPKLTSPPSAKKLAADSWMKYDKDGAIARPAATVATGGARSWGVTFVLLGLFALVPGLAAMAVSGDTQSLYAFMEELIFGPPPPPPPPSMTPWIAGASCVFIALAVLAGYSRR